MSAKNFYTLEELHRWNEIAPSLVPPAKLAVIGDPITHSLSPQMHNPALKERGINAQYIRVLVPEGSVESALRLFALHGFVGVNCTIPHKFEALVAVDEVDGQAQLLGAVNTVVIDDWKIKGFNSDGPGFLRSVQDAFCKPVRELRVAVLGAGGGAGHAVAIQCALEHCRELILVNRTPEKIRVLARVCADHSPRTEVKTCAWDDDALASVIPAVDLIVNATPIGMKHNDRPLFDCALLHAAHLVFDMVYRSDGTTPLIAAAKAVGAQVCDGLTLLLHQGAISFAHWFGEPVPLEAMRAGVSREHSESSQ